jgi:hypothetical protein
MTIAMYLYFLITRSCNFSILSTFFYTSSMRQLAVQIEYYSIQALLYTRERHQATTARTSDTTNTSYRLARGKRLSVLASITRTLTDLLRLITRIITLVLHTDLADVGGAGAAVDGGRVTQVAVDTDQGLAGVRDHVLDGHGASILLVAVAAGPVELAKVVDGEAVDVHLAARVVLDDLVVGTLGTAADDVVRAAAALEREGVCVALAWSTVNCMRVMLTLADGLPPDVLDGAGAEAVHALELVGTNDGVLQGTALLDQEDGVVLTALALSAAGDATAEGLVATVVGLAGGDFIGLVKGHAALGVGDGELGQGGGGQQGEEKSFLIHGDL